MPGVASALWKDDFWKKWLLKKKINIFTLCYSQGIHSFCKKKISKFGSAVLPDKAIVYEYTDDCIKAWNNLFMNKML